MRYVHLPLNEEIRSIGGYYVVLQEGTLEVDGREVLYVLKGAHVETSCCGSGGMGFLSVPGYLVSWKSGKNPDGLDTSEVERIKEPGERHRIRSLLEAEFPYITAVDFG